MLVDEGTDVVENRAENVLRGLVWDALADCLAIGAELLIEAVDVDDEPEPSKRAVSEFIRIDPKCPSSTLMSRPRM
jgi:hypothetical protein